MTSARSIRRRNARARARKARTARIPQTAIFLGTTFALAAPSSAGAAAPARSPIRTRRPHRPLQPVA
jgi:hypothetical protein